MTTRRYAETTTVSVQKSQQEVQHVLMRQGADQVILAWDADMGAAVRFRMSGHYAQLVVPPPSERRMKELKLRFPSWDETRRREQEERRCWRALLLLVKAKLEAIASGITSMEREFMPDLLLSDGRRLEAWAGPILAEMYESGSMPLLPAHGSGQ